MRYKGFSLLSILLSTTVVMAYHNQTPSGSIYRPPRGAARPPGQSQNATAQLEKQIEDRDKGLNGIQVGEPKVYDDSLLQQMLNNAQAKLAAIQLLDQSGIAAKIGAVTGASQQISSFGLNVQGPSIPGVVTTDKGATGSTKETAALSVNPQGQPSTTNTVEATSGLPTRDVVTTVPVANPPAVTAPAPTTSLPSSFSVSSSDVLNEQLQLTYEIANLRLMIEGSLSDRFFNNQAIRAVKPRVTLGFPITLHPDARYKDAVAIVEVKIQKNHDLSDDPKKHDDGEPPTITALLPREKTYNVASITDNSTSIGGGVVTQIVGVSGSWLRGRKTHYLVQDQDTLALTFQPENEPNDKKRVGFLWQFRPVLGRRYVKGGLRQTFVQVAFPSNWSADVFGKIHVRTYWRKYDRKNGIVKEVISGSLRDNAIVPWDIPRYKLELAPRIFNKDSLEDLGRGQMLVKLFGRFLSGTYVRIGSTILGEGSPGLRFEHYGIRFIAPIADLASKRVVLVSRDGEEIPLQIPDLPSERKPPEIVGKPKVTSVDETNSLVEITLNDPKYLEEEPRLLFDIGGLVFGYSDAPLIKNGATLSAVVPTSWLIAHPEVAVKPLFAPVNYKAPVVKVDVLTHLSQNERLVVLEQSRTWAKFLLYGNRLKDVSVLHPIGATVHPIGRPEDEYTLRMIHLSADQIRSHKNLVIQRSGERPILVPIPPVEFKDVKESKPTERLPVNADEVVIEGEGLKDLQEVTYNGRSIPFEPSPDGRTVRLKNLRAHGVTSTATIKMLEFTFKASKANVRLEVVNRKVENVPK